MELADLSKKSYTLNHAFDKCIKSTVNMNKPNDSNNYVAKNNNNKEIHQEISSQTPQSGSDIKPKMDAIDAENIARKLYGITLGEIKELVSYDDRNFWICQDPNIKNPLITNICNNGYVLKILNAHDSKKIEIVEAQTMLCLYLRQQKIECPEPIANVNGQYFSTEFINGSNYTVRLFAFIPGKIFHEVPKTNYLIFQSGEYIANIDRLLRKFSHPAYKTHKTLWMLQSIPELKELLYVVKDFSRKEIVEEIIESFEKKILPNVDSFEQQIIHGDYNEQNIIVNQVNGQSHYKVTGVIDFGDTNWSPVIFEVSIAMAYKIIATKNLSSGGIFLAGYTSVRPLLSEEKKYLKYCVAARLAQSLIIGAYTHSLNPWNDYVLVTQEIGWKLIEQLWREKFTKIDELWDNTADEYLKQSFK